MILVDVNDPVEALGWRQAMLLLALDRFQPLHGLLGLPVGMVEHAPALLDVAQQFWELEAGLDRVIRREAMPVGRDEYQLGTDVLLKGPFLKLNRAYPEEEVRALVAWAGRHYVTKADRSCLFLWGQVLPIALARRAYVDLPQGSGVAFERVFSTHFDKQVKSEDARAIAAVEAAAPSPFEVALARARTDLHALVTDGVDETIRNERAFRGLSQMAPHLDDRDHFLTWARSVGKTIGMKGEQLQWPRSLGGQMS